MQRKIEKNFEDLKTMTFLQERNYIIPQIGHLLKKNNAEFKNNFANRWV